MSVAKPIIGIPADRRMHGDHPFHQVGEKYIRAVTDCVDGIPLQIPVLADHLEIDELLGIVDGVLFSGSPSDIEPHHYKRFLNFLRKHNCQLPFKDYRA